MAADLLLVAVAAALAVGGTDRGRAAAKGFAGGVSGRSAGKKKTARKAPAKSAPGRGGPVSRKKAKKGALAGKVGGWAGRQARRATGAAGRATKAGAVKAGGWASDRAQTRWSGREHSPPPVWRTQDNAPAEPITADDQPSPTTADTTGQSTETTDTSTTEEATMNEFDAPSSDGEFLGTLHTIAEQAKALAQAMEDWASVLGGMGLARSVVAHVEAAAGSIAEASHEVVAAGRDFEAHYEDARQVASKGMHIRGEDAAA